ncbi:low-density lipoprotein receptor-related protein 2-like [Bufo bufo]|uniref:low-density lipoprotein receptor-related protein 2-like n=1 Tax=Bufo bufo TaxID=8384 RepID=UPI001ABE012F|nr:low-density lipoprotein receptor-related protein 2-like [Bufo bufo]
MHCDGDNDCEDHSDEVNCTISKPLHCQNGDFRCQSGECILKEWKCDDAKDCKDGSDEKVDLQKLNLVDQKVPTKNEIASLTNVNQISSIDFIMQDRTLVFAVKHGLEGRRNSPKLACANMDGTNRRILWRKSKAVVGLTFADSGTRLYWADRGYGTIESIKVDGTSYKVVRSRLHGVNMFTVEDNVLFWTTFDNDTGRVWFSKIGTSENKYFEMNQKVLYLKVSSRPAQQAKNQCSQNNGGCSQICLPNLESRTCRCSPTHRLVDETICLEEPKCTKGYLLCKDGLKCVPNSNICDNQKDCLDGSDEKGCAFSSNEKSLRPVTPPKKPKVSTEGMAHPRLYEETTVLLKTKPPTPESNTFSENIEELEDDSLTNEDYERKMEYRPCNRKTCNMRGECTVDAGVIKCSCFSDYSGEFCEDGVKPLAVPLTVGTIAVLLVCALVAGAFVYVSRRKALQRTSSSASSMTLTRQPAKDMEPLEDQNKESSETFLNDVFDAEGSAAEQELNAASLPL